MPIKNDKSSIFPLWDIEITGEFRKKVPVVRKNDQPAKAPIPRVQSGKKRGRKKKPLVILPDTPSKTCVICGNIFYRRPTHTDEQWERLAICPNKSCIGKYAKSHVKRSGPLPSEFLPRVCVICEKTYYRKNQAIDVWEKHQTCSQACVGKLMSLNSIEDDSEPDTIDISPRIKISELSLSIPDIVLVELQKNALENNVSTSDVAMVAIIEYLLRVNSDNTTIKTSIKRFFKKPEVKPKE